MKSNYNIPKNTIPLPQKVEDLFPKNQCRFRLVVWNSGEATEVQCTAKATHHEVLELSEHHNYCAKHMKTILQSPTTKRQFEVI